MTKLKIIIKQILQKIKSVFIKFWKKLVRTFIRLIEELNILTSKHGTKVFIILEVGLMLFCRYYYNDIKPSDQALLQNFIEWFGIIYALILTIIVDQCRNKYNKVNHELDREADALILLYQTGEMFPNSTWKVALLETIKFYAAEICELKTKDHRSEGNAHEKMKTIHECIIGLINRTKKIDGCVKSELLHEYNEAYDARGDRFDLLNQKLPIQVWIILGLISLLWFWGFLILDIKSEGMKNYVLGATTFSISYLFYLARDLDDLYTGNFRPNFSSFEHNFSK